MMDVIARREVARQVVAVTSAYDEANRMVQRIIPAVLHPKANCTTGGERNSPCMIGLHFDSLLVRPDTQTFDYDIRGSMIAAHNRYARVKRTYFPGGALQTDTIRFRSYGNPDMGSASQTEPPPECDDPECEDSEFWGGGGIMMMSGLTGDPYPDGEYTFAYGIGHTHDRNGRPKTLVYPSGIPGTSTSTVNLHLLQLGSASARGRADGIRQRSVHLYVRHKRPAVPSEPVLRSGVGPVHAGRSDRLAGSICMGMQQGIRSRSRILSGWLLVRRDNDCVNPLKMAVGSANIVRGAVGTASGVIILSAGVATTPVAGIGLPAVPVGVAKIAFGLANVSRGAGQFSESLSSSSGPSARNLLGLLPFGQEYDDPDEPGPVEYFRLRIAEFGTDPVTSATRVLKDFFAVDGGDK